MAINIKKRGRPPLPNSKLRTERKQVFFSPAELRIVRKRATEERIKNLPEYIRQCALGEL